MSYAVCLEQMEVQWIAHVPALPGCFASDPSQAQAMSRLPQAVEDYLAWRSKHAVPASAPEGPAEVDEVIRSWISEEDYEVNAFFAADRPPLIVDELPLWEKLLGASRHDLLAALEGAGKAELAAQAPGERWPLVGVLKHIAGAEWWYFDRLDLSFPREAMPEDAFDRLEKVRSHTLETLPSLAARTGVVTRSGETWSARKVLRRALWHERDHTVHIGKLRAALRPGG